jgi:hypothetical protein
LDHFTDDPNNEKYEHIATGTGLWCARQCAMDNCQKCFNSSMIKICDHSIDKYMLNTVGDYVLFQANCFHRGYFYITSNSIYYTAQLFATSSGKQTPRSFWNRQTAMVSTIRCKELTDLSTDIMNYWERKDKYMNDMFNPQKIRQ